MTTETEPMVRIVAIKCPDCGTEFSTETCPDWEWGDPMPISQARKFGEKKLWCEDDDRTMGCGQFTRNLIVTEPV